MRLLNKLLRRLPPNWRAKMKELAEGPGIETSVLRPYAHMHQASTIPRLNLVVPSLAAKTAFGGIQTGLLFFSHLANVLSAEAKIDCRVIVEQFFDENEGVLIQTRRETNNKIEILDLTKSNWTIATRDTDIFILFNWWTSYNIESVLSQQGKFEKFQRLPKIHLAQEFEPAFYPMSSAHQIATEVFSISCRPIWIICNTKMLADHFQRLALTGSKILSFEPRLHPALLRRLNGLGRIPEKKRQILVYGRPSIKRNCFSLLVKGLEFWSRHSAHTESWRIISAGTKHRDIQLSQNCKIESLGKLSIQDYGTLLHESAIGISLMASPHPSYPPLEMAHFGIMTITNRYLDKDISRLHGNISSATDTRPETIAMLLDDLIVRFEQDPTIGQKGQTNMPDFLSEKEFECIGVLARSLTNLL